MNKTALSLVAAVHVGAATLLATLPRAPAKPQGQSALQLRWVQAPVAARQAVVARPATVSLPAVAWVPFPAPALPAVVAVASALTPPSAMAVAALPVALTEPAPAAGAHSSGPAAAAAPIERAAALPPEHGLCSARGVQRHYPALLRERGIEGQVLLRVQVDEQGRAAEVRIQGGSGWRLLDEAARRIAADCPYVPARRGDQPLVAWVEYPLRFALH